MISKESGTVRYAYGVAMALLLGGTAFSSPRARPAHRSRRTRPALRWRRAPARRCPSRTSSRRLQPAVVNISTKQRVPVETQRTRSSNSSASSATRPPPTRATTAAAAAAAARARTREAGSLGSGFIISPDGYIVTNNHLIAGLTGTGVVDQVTVTTTERQGISGADRRPRRDVRPGLAQDRRPRHAVRSVGR